MRFEFKKTIEKTTEAQNAEMPSTSSSPPKTKLVWVRDKKKSEKIHTSLPAVTLSVRSISDELQEARSELASRARQIQDLCALTSTLRVLIVKINSDSFDKEDLDSVMPPAVYPTRANGCRDGLEFIRETVHGAKPVLVSLFREKLKAQSELNQVSTALGEIKITCAEDTALLPDNQLTFENFTGMVETVSRVTEVEDE